MEAEDEAEAAAGTPLSERSLAVGPDSGRLLFALVAPNAGCEVLEIGGSRGYSTIWLAVRGPILGGRVVSLEQDARKIAAWRGNIAEAGLDEWAELVEGDAKETLPALEDGFDVVFLDAWKDDYELFFGLARTKLDPGGVVVADNVGSNPVVQAYAAGGRPTRASSRSRCSSATASRSPPSSVDRHEGVCDARGDRVRDRTAHVGRRDHNEHLHSEAVLIRTATWPSRACSSRAGRSTTALPSSRERAASRWSPTRGEPPSR